MQNQTPYLTLFTNLSIFTKLIIIFTIALVSFGVTAFSAQDEVKITTVFLVRHAEKATSPADDPPLLDIGSLRAKQLAHVLGNAQIKAIYTSELLRTKQTAEPLAKHLGIESTTIPIKTNLKESFKETAKKVYEKPGENVLVVGHSNTLPEIIKELGANANITIDETEYDNLFIVTIYGKGKATLTRLKY
ncbi:MAG: histidine phosphatase family protein [Acidobacteria bacterium]|nr:histidine phosphatase family protein [Acidobacteriota bacterium]